MKALTFKRLAVCLAIVVCPATALPQPSPAEGNRTPGMVFNDNSAAYPSEITTGADDNGASPSGRPDDDGSPITCSNLPLAQQEVCHSHAVDQDSRDDPSSGAVVLPGDVPL